MFLGSTTKVRLSFYDHQIADTDDPCRQYSNYKHMVDSTGVLQCLDGYMNIAMEQTEEHVNGIVTNRYGDAFIRGNNG